MLILGSGDGTAWRNETVRQATLGDLPNSGFSNEEPGGGDWTVRRREPYWLDFAVFGVLGYVG